MFRKILILAIAIVIGLIWLFYAIGFGFFGLIGFFATAYEKGFRTTLCGSSGCSDFDFFFSVAWVLGMIFIIYILPIVIIIYFFHKRRKGK